MPASAFGGEMQHIIQWTSAPVGGVGARQWRAVYQVHSAGAVEIQSGGVFFVGRIHHRAWSLVCRIGGRQLVAYDQGGWSHRGRAVTVGDGG